MQPSPLVPLRSRRLVLAVLAASAILVSSLGPARADDWETGVGGTSKRYGRSAEVGPAAPQILWQGSLPGIVAQQAVIGEGLAVVNRIANFTIPTGTWIVAHEIETGDIRWQVQLPFNDPNEWRSKVSAIRDGRVYATRSGGEVNPAALYALDPADGSILWQSEALIEERTTESLAFASNGDPIVGNFTSVVRIDATDGTTVWTIPRSTPSSNGAEVAVYEDRGYIWEPSPSGPIVTALDLAAGARLYSSVAVAGGLVQQLGLFVGPDGTVYAPRTQNNPATDFLVAYTDTGFSFEERWRIPIGYIPFASHAVGPDGTVYAYRTVRDGSTVEITILRLDPADGSILDESAPLPGDFPASPRIAVDAAGRIHFTNGGFASGAVFSFDPDLTLRWTEPLTNVNLGGPAIGPDGTMVVCGVGSDVRAYRTPDEFALNAPEPGLAGEVNLVAIRGATPGERLFLGVGSQPGSTNVPGCPGVSIGIGDPRLARIVRADDDGRFALEKSVPPGKVGVTILVQVVEKATCRVSNLVIHTFE
jgi:outer membrane protein assembly factor BamB